MQSSMPTRSGISVGARSAASEAGVQDIRALGRSAFVDRVIADSGFAGVPELKETERYPAGRTSGSTGCPLRRR